MPSILGNDIDAPEEEDSEYDDFLIFPLTEINKNDDDGEGSDDDIEIEARRHRAYAARRRSTFGMGQFQPAMTLKSRRRSLLTGCFSESGLLANRASIHESNTAPNMRNFTGLQPGPVVQFECMSPRERWKHALRLIRTLKDPWKDFIMSDLPAEVATRHRYNALKQKWVVDQVNVKVENEPFNHGAMRSCYRLKKLDGIAVYKPDWKQQGRNYVAKMYMEDVNRDVYFEDVRLQMDAKLWGEEYNRHQPPKKVDVLQMSVIEFPGRPGSPLFHLEHFIDGTYIKYNSNSGFVDENLRFTPQAFSHFTFEKSSHKMIVVDVQGVGDLWTDPQIHTADGKGYGDGNLGVRGMALFFHSHICNCICETLKLSKFDLAESEAKEQTNFIKMQKSYATRLRSIDEGSHSMSPVDSANIVAHFERRLRTISTTSSVFSDDSGGDILHRENSTDEQISLSPESFQISSPFGTQRKLYVGGDSDDSSSATTTEEEERTLYQRALRSGSRPSCVAQEIDLRALQNNAQYGGGETSLLGQIHHELAVYHEIGRFCTHGEPFDVKAALFHEKQAADLGIKEAILTLAKIYLGLSHDILPSISIESSTDILDAGVKYMLAAATAGDRSAMLYVAKAYESGIGLGSGREKNYQEAVNWYDKAANMNQEDDSGEFDATMDDPVYQIKAVIAQLYLTGGYQLEKDASYAGELFTEAAEGATAAMKGRLASKYYALAEEAWAECEG